MSRDLAAERARLRAALEPTGDPVADQLIRGSLALATHGDAELATFYRQETAPKQVALDLHLTGAGVEGHATSAADLATFVARISTATKAIARQLAGTKRHHEALLIEGVAPGSVRLVLRAPDEKPLRPVLTDAPVETVDSKALRRVASVLALASDDDQPADGSDPLAAAVADLPTEARDSLRSAAQQILKAQWDVGGVVRQWRQPEDGLNVTSRGAEHLRSALALQAPERSRYTIVGTLDGFRRSSAVAYITPSTDGARPLAVAVTDPVLFHRVAQMAAYEDLAVRATVNEWQAVRPDGSPGRIARQLHGIDSLGEQDGLELA